MPEQFRRIPTHAVNLISNLLPDDLLSSRLRGALLRLGGARLGPGTTVRGGGYFPHGSFMTGARCYINRSCYFDFTGSVTLGDDVVVGHGVTFVTATHALGGPERRAGRNIEGRPIVVRDGAWIGANATILPGTTVGEGAVVAAGAVVSADVPPNAVAMGVPAKVSKRLKDDPPRAEDARP